MELKTKILIAILCLAAFLRFYHLSSNPPGLYVDEISFGYNAYSILKTGRDEYGVFLPTSIRSFDDYKAPFYAYILVPTIAVLGLSEFAVRFPSAFFGTLSVILVYLLVLKIFKDKNMALIASFMHSISPWHLQFSRAGFEANVMLFFELLGFIFFLYAKGRLKYLTAAAISFGLAFQTYHGARVWIPAFLVIITIYYWKDFIRLKGRLLIPILILIIFVAPSFINFSKVTTRAREVSILGQKNIVQVFVQNYLSHFSPVFLFFSGDSIGRHSVPGIGEQYIFTIPFMIIGLITLIRKKQRNCRLLIAWFLVAPIPASIAAPAPHALRDITSLPLWSTISSLGIVTFAQAKFNYKLKTIAFLIIGIVMVYNIATYFHLYYVHYPKEKAIDWSVGTKEMVLYVNSIKNNYSNIYITKNYSIPYIYFLFYLKYDPATYQKEHGSNSHFDKYYFFNGSVPISYPKNSLIVSDNGGHQEKILKEVIINGDDLIYRIGE